MKPHRPAVGDQGPLQATSGPIVAKMGIFLSCVESRKVASTSVK